MYYVYTSQNYLFLFNPLIKVLNWLMKYCPLSFLYVGEFPSKKRILLTFYGLTHSWIKGEPPFLPLTHVLRPPFSLSIPRSFINHLPISLPLPSWLELLAGLWRQNRDRSEHTSFECDDMHSHSSKKLNVFAVLL